MRSLASGIEQAASETNHALLSVEHRQHHPITKEIVLAALARAHQSQALRVGGTDVFLRQIGLQGIPAGRRVSDPKPCAQLGADPAPRDIGARGFPSLRREALLEEARGQIHHAQQAVSLRLGIRPRAPLGRRQRLALGDLHAGLLGQIAQNLGERPLLDLHQKPEHVPFFAAPKAVKELARFVHVKRRRLLGVERAKPLPASGARALQFHVSLDHVDEVRPVANVVDLFSRDQRHGPSILSPRASFG